MLVYRSFHCSKGLNICIYWISYEYFRPQDRIKHWYSKQKLTIKSDQRQNFHFHLSHLVPSNSAENWYWGQPRQSTAHKSLEIWQNSNENFHFHPNNLLLVQLVQLTNWLKIGWFCMKIKGLKRTSSLHPPPGSSILVFTSLFPPAGLQDGVGQGRPPIIQIVLM